MHINKRTYDDQRTEDAPKPEILCGKIICDASSLQLGAHTVADIVRPDDRQNAEGQPGEHKYNERVMHGLLTVVTLRDGINLGRDLAHDNKTVDTECDQRKQDISNKAAISFQLADRLRGGLLINRLLVDGLLLICRLLLVYRLLLMSVTL